MMQPKLDNASCPIANSPVEVLLMTLNHLDLKDVFVARFVCKDFHAIASSILAKREKEAYDEARRKPPPKWAQNMSAVGRFESTLAEANFFYEQTLTAKPQTFWCNRCRQIKERRSFSDSQYSNPHKTSGRFCWKCSGYSQIFKFEGVRVFACAASNCERVEKLHEASLACWWHKRGMICVACWPEHRRTISKRLRNNYRFVCGSGCANPITCWCKEDAQELADAADVEACRSPLS